MVPELDRLRSIQHEYEPNEEARKRLAGKVLSMVVAPTAVGKSTLINGAISQLEQHKEHSGLAWTITTRNRRYELTDGETDPPFPIYQTADDGITHGNLMRRIIAGEVANYSIHLNESIYATHIDGFTNHYTFLPTLPSSVPILQRAGFERTETTFITASVGDWKQWLARRSLTLAASDRAEEAVQNLEFAQQHADRLHFVHNDSAKGGREKATDNLIDITLGMPILVNKEIELKAIDAMLIFAKAEAVAARGKV